MDEIRDILLQGYKRYFAHLSQFGTTNKTSQNSLLITLYIYQMLSGPLSVHITNEDFNTIERLLYCLNGESCLIDYYKFKANQTMFDWDHDEDPTKILELSGDIRIAKSGDVRFHIL